MQLPKTLEIEPNFWFAHAYLGRTYRKLGRLPEAVAELQKAGQLSGGTVEHSPDLRCLRYTRRKN
jgi:cytochrome c-type biogenesis protein CcmH/NrfG